MKQKIAIVYSSVDGQTLKICKKLYHFFSQKELNTTLHSVDTLNKNILNVDVLIIGASIRYGKHNDKIINFILENKEDLKNIKTAFFSVNLVARKKAKSLPNTNPYVIKFLQETNWNPNFIDVFAGKLNYKLYSLTDKILIKFIMFITKGPLKTKEPIEFTNWKRVDNFGAKIYKHLKTLG